MSVDTWKGGDANWNIASDWSDGLPNASDDVVVSSGQVNVTHTIGTVAEISISGSKSLVSIENTVGGKVSGTVSIGKGAELGMDLLNKAGGSTLDVVGTLTNNGLIQLGNANLSLATNDTLMVGAIDNIGTIDLFGCAGMDPRAFATLDVTGGVAGFSSAGVLEGNVVLESCAVVEFKSGQIKTIAANGSLVLDGYFVYVADASDTTSDSALLGLNDVAGSLVLDGGATVSVSGNLTDSGFIGLDHGQNMGGSSLTIKGKLTNSGRLVIGAPNGTLSRDDFVTAATLDNMSYIGLNGGGGHMGRLNVTGSIVNTGTIDLYADTEKLGGAISGSGGVLGLFGASTLEFGGAVGAGQTVEFESASSAVLIDTADAFHATLTGLRAGDQIDFSHVPQGALKTSVTNIGADSFTLNLTSGAHSAALNFSGFAYKASDFQYLAFDGASGLEIKFV